LKRYLSKAIIVVVAVFTFIGVRNDFPGPLRQLGPRHSPLAAAPLGAQHSPFAPLPASPN